MSFTSGITLSKPKQTLERKEKKHRFCGKLFCEGSFQVFENEAKCQRRRFGPFEFANHLWI